MKGISPLIASVLLIAFTVSVALIMQGWTSSMTRTTTQNISSQSINVIACSSAGINIDSIYLNNTACSAVIMNTGGIDISSSLSFISSNGSVFSSPLYQVNKSASSVAEISTCPVSCYTFSKAIATTNCPGITRIITDKRKVFVNGIKCSDCDPMEIGMVLETVFSGTGNSTTDYSQYSNNGVCYNMPNSNCNWTTGIYDSYGYGITFDGTDDFLNISETESLNIEDSVTVEAWIKSGSSNKFILAKDPWSPDLDNWTYRQAVNISNTAGNLTNYQVNVTYNFSTEYSEGKINSTCKDLRFTYYNSSSKTNVQLPFWIENCSLSSFDNITAWVKIPVLQNNTNTTIYMYYGNNASESASNGVSTFDFFDDFNDGSIADWNTYTKNQGYDDDPLQTVTAIYYLSTPYSLAIRSTDSCNHAPFDLTVGVNKTLDLSLDNYTIDFGYMNRLYVDCYSVFIAYSYVNVYINNVLLHQDYTSCVPSDGECSSYVTWKKQTNTTPSISSIALEGVGSRGSIPWIYFDNVRIRKYATTEPSTTFGSEENYTENSENITDMPYALTTNAGGEFIIIKDSVVYNLTADGDINDDQWHHLAATYDGFEMKLYRDGSLEASSSQLSGVLPSFLGDLKIGCNYSSTTSGNFNGTIGKIRIYNRSLSASEIQMRYLRMCDR